MKNTMKLFVTILMLNLTSLVMPTTKLNEESPAKEEQKKTVKKSPYDLLIIPATSIGAHVTGRITPCAINSYYQWSKLHEKYRNDYGGAELNDSERQKTDAFFLDKEAVRDPKQHAIHKQKIRDAARIAEVKGSGLLSAAATLATASYSLFCMVTTVRYVMPT